MNNREEITKEELENGATNLEAALVGLDAYIYQNISYQDTSMDDINGLVGLVQGILLLAEKVTKDVTAFSLDTRLEVKND